MQHLSRTTATHGWCDFPVSLHFCIHLWVVFEFRGFILNSILVFQSPNILRGMKTRSFQSFFVWRRIPRQMRTSLLFGKARCGSVWLRCSPLRPYGRWPHRSSHSELICDYEDQCFVFCVLCFPQQFSLINIKPNNTWYSLDSDLTHRRLLLDEIWSVKRY